MAKTDTTSISLDELKEVSNALQKQKEIIYSTYSSKIVPVLQSTRTCFSVSGLDYTSIEDTFKNTFVLLDNNYESLINVLNNNVIQGYSDVALSLKKMFNEDFASKLRELL